MPEVADLPVKVNIGPTNPRRCHNQRSLSPEHPPVNSRNTSSWTHLNSQLCPSSFAILAHCPYSERKIRNELVPRTVPNTMHSPSNTPGAKLNRGRMMMNTQC